MTDKATIFDIQRSSYHDGPGIRTAVFFKGCNLKCLWCHNPESQSFKKEILFYEEKCLSCGACRGVTAEAFGFSCPNGAKEICGRDYTADELLEIIAKDKLFYETSGGGVTFSGGECMMKIDFLEEILKKCKERGIHTAIDTAGCVPWESFLRVLPLTDMFLYDIKAYDTALHKKYTGVKNELILDNLAQLLKSGARVWVRIPLIPGVNDSDEELSSIRKFFEENGYPENVEFLPYHAMGEHKYRALGREITLFDVPSDAKIEKARAIFEK